MGWNKTFILWRYEKLKHLNSNLRIAFALIKNLGWISSKFDT